jgi:hypothetical protein
MKNERTRGYSNLSQRFLLNDSLMGFPSIGSILIRKQSQNGRWLLKLQRMKSGETIPQQKYGQLPISCGLQATRR